MTKLQSQLDELDEKTRETMEVTLKHLSAAFATTGQAFLDFAEKVNKYIHQVYVDSGMPYGDNAEVMLRWLDEQASDQVNV